MPTYSFLISKSLNQLFWLISVAIFTIVNVIAAYMRNGSRVLNIIAVITFVTMIIRAVLTFPQVYSDSMDVTSIWFGNNAQWMIWIYYFISLAITVLTGLSIMTDNKKYYS